MREALSWEELWRGDDQGLITAWELGRTHSQNNIELAGKAVRGELPVLGWKGGVDRLIKKKFGTLLYLAMWQGLRGEDLLIDTDHETAIECTLTKSIVIFTGNGSKFADE